MNRPKIETKHLFFSKTKNCKTLFEQTQSKAEKAIEFELTKPRETFFSNHQSQLKNLG